MQSHSIVQSRSPDSMFLRLLRLMVVIALCLESAPTVGAWTEIRSSPTFDQHLPPALLLSQGENPPGPSAPGGQAPERATASKQAVTGVAAAQFDPAMRLVMLSATKLAYTSYVYTHSDILLFAYTNGTVFEVYYSSGTLLWTGTLNAGQHQSLTPGAGVYLVAASNAFSANVGDALTDYVLGYYAMDQNGKGLSKLFYTYQSYWYGDRTYDPHFIIFAYEDNTQITLKNSTTNQTLWTGTLNSGQHYDDPNRSGEFLTVSSSRPVAALSYTDQGYYVPASNGTFVGTKFHTFVGNSGGWIEDLNLIAYENASIIVSDSTTHTVIWTGTLNAGQVHSLPNLNGRYVTISATANVAVSVSPFASASGGRYYHSLYGQDSSGTGIGTYFLFPAIPAAWDVTCRLILFSYVDNAEVTVNDRSGTQVWSGVLNRAQSQTLYTSYTVYSIISNGSISALLDCGDSAGADFAPVHYAALDVTVTSPVGQSYRNYGSVFVAANVKGGGQPLLGGTVAGQIVPVTGGQALEFGINDRGLAGDPIANDGQYAAAISLLGPTRMPPGNYFLLVSAQKSIDGQLASGSGSSIFSVTGAPSGALSVNPTLTCPNGAFVYVGDTCSVSLQVTYPDGQLHPEGMAALTLHQPDLTDKRVSLSYSSSNTWQGTVNFTVTGRYLLDYEAQPIWGLPYIGGYASAVVDTLKSSQPLVIVPLNLPNTFHKNQLVIFSANVSQAGTSLSDATVQAVINPGGKIVRLSSIGNGLYSGVYQARSPGSYTIDFAAISPFYRMGTATLSFSVDTISADLIDTVVRASNKNTDLLDKMKEYALHVAQDGDWFQSKVGPDEYKRGFDLFVNVISLGISGMDAAKALSQAATKSTAPVAARFSGLKLFKWLEGKPPTLIDGRVFRSWATRLQNSTSSGLLVDYLKDGRFPPNIGWGVLRRAAVYYVAKITGKTMTDIAIDQAGTLLANQRQSNAQLLQNVIYPIFAQSADEDTSLISEYALDIQTNPPTVPDAVQDALITDLIQRTDFNQSLVEDTQQRNGNLWTAHELRLEEEDPFSVASIMSYGETLLKITTPIVVGIACGGPVGAGVGVVIAAGTVVEDWIHDTENMNMDHQMSGFAFGSMQTMLETKEALTENIESGLASVRRGTMPTVPDGAITYVQDEIQTEYVLFEKRVVTSMTINNSGTSGANFNIRAFGAKTGWLGKKTEYYWVDVIDDRVTSENDVGWIYLAPGQSRNVQVVWKDKDRKGLDMRPDNGSWIYLYLTAQTLDGQYVVHQYMYNFNTLTMSEMAAAQTSFGQPIMSYPVSEQVGRDRYGDEYIVNIRVQNPLPYPASMVVAQAIPTGIKVLSPGGGMTLNDNIQWQRVIQPHETSEFKLTVQNSLGGSSVITMSASTATFFVLQSLSELTFTGTPVAIAAPNHPTVYLPFVARNFTATPTDTYEPNDTMAQAYGPLPSGAVYASYISSSTDNDYYYFDISSLGKITVDLSNIYAPNTDYDLELYNAAGLLVGGSWGVTTTEQIVFEPVTTGRYYVLAYFCCGDTSPARPYYLRAQFNGSKASGDIYGTVRANGYLVSGVPIQLDFYDYNTYDYRRVWSVTDGSGRYHFWGMNTLGPNQVYYPYYGYSLGPSYIGYWYGADITAYTAGSSLFGGDIDISPLNLGTPNSSTGIPLPVTFTWTSRSTSPSETYRLRLYDPCNYNTYWWSSDLGHASNFTLTGLPTGFTTGHAYRWRVYIYGSDGSGGGSYYTNLVAFSSSTATTLDSAAMPWRPDKTDIASDRKPVAPR